MMIFASLGAIPTAPNVKEAHAASSQWISWASKGWRYFQPGAGVDSSKGLSHAAIGWPYFTEWDLGTYILAILDAEKIGILPRDGPWGSTDRLNKIIAFLQTRQLTPNGISYVWYDARTGSPALGLSSDETNVSDLGFLLIALDKVKRERSEYAATIDYIIHTRENIAYLASSTTAWATTSGVYKWYVAHGFKFFGFDTYAPVEDALNTLQTVLSGPQLVTYNVALPVADITSEPVLLAAFTLDPEPGFQRLVLKAYLAQQNRYAATAKFTGFSEGPTGNPTPSGCSSYVYEWIVRANSETWAVTPWSCSATPVAYIKVGFGFYALFGTQYALDLINHVNGTFTDWTYGYYDGLNDGQIVVNNIVDRTQGILLAAARYALETSAPPLLSGYPTPFAGSPLNVTFIIGDTNPHPPYDWRAYTLDLMGSLGVASKLGQISTSGYSTGKMDTWVTTWDSASGTAGVDWSKIGVTNVITIGGPPVNLFAYHYEQFGAIPFYQTWQGITPYIRSDLTGTTYAYQWGVTDYALITITHDSGRTILVGWGLTHRGTVAICQLLQYFDTQYAGLLSGRAMIVKWVDVNGDTEVDPGDQITVVEVWP